MKTFIYILIVLKLFFTIFCTLEITGFTASIKISPFGQNCNVDEWDIANIAFSYNSGHYFSRIHENSDTSYYVKTAYRPFIPVMFHVYYQKAFNACFYPLKRSDLNLWAKPLYFKIYAQIQHWLTFILTVISIPFYQRIIEAVTGSKNKYIICVFLGVYIIIPSSLIYIGLLPMYENIVVPCLVILVSLLIPYVQNTPSKDSYSVFKIAFLSASIIAIRPQATFSILLIGIYSIGCLIYFIKSKKGDIPGLFKIIAFTLISTGLVQGYTMYINYTLWGKYTLSTRGDALLWGHNPLARGSWDGTFDLEGSPGYTYQIEQIPGLLQMNEYQSSREKSNLAIKNIINNPKHEVWLFARKTAIYFLPYHYLNHHFDPILFIVQTGFILYVLYFMKNLKTECKNKAKMLSLIVVLGVYLVNVLYFIEYRIRYLGDPFMLALAAAFYVKIARSVPFLNKWRNY